jgi:hypothetical protein
MAKGAMILGLLVLTSIAACAVMSATGRMSAHAAGEALWGACEVIGLVVVFFVANVATWTAFVIISRALTRYSPSFYVLADDSLFVLSALQALIFSHWPESRTAGRSRVPSGREAPRLPAPQGSKDRQASASHAGERSQMTNDS